MIKFMSSSSNPEWPIFKLPNTPLTISPPTSFQWMTHFNRLKYDGYTIFKSLLPMEVFPPLNNAFDDLALANILPVGICLLYTSDAADE